MLLRFHFVSKIILFLLIVTLVFSCNGNAYTELSNKTTEEALLENAIKSINLGNYDAAIAFLDQIISGFRHEAKVTKTAAAAYAGKCGLNFFNMITSITAVTADSPMLLMMKAFQTVTVTPASCDTAQFEIEIKYGATSASRPSDINLFMAILGLAKMGTYLRSLADIDQTGTVDVAFADACAVATITDLNTKKVGTGLGLVLDNITALTAAVAGNSAITGLATLQAACGAACVITDVNSANWTPANIKIIRSAIKSTSFGIQGCVDPVFTNCCP